MAGRQEIPWRRYYTRDPVLSSVILATVSWLVVVWIGFAAPSGWTPDVVGVTVILTVAYVVAMWRMLRWGVYVDDEGVCVVDFFSTV